MGKHLNEKLKKAIEEKCPLFWEFGEYRKYYTGLILRAHTGHAENGRVYTRIVFGTNSLEGANEIREHLRQQGIDSDNGWKKAVERYEDNARAWRNTA